MAGIGFELRRLERDDTFLGTLQGLLRVGSVLAAAIACAITAMRTNHLPNHLPKHLEHRILTSNPFSKASQSTANP